LFGDIFLIIQAPALTVIARRRNSQSLAYPVGLRRRNSRAAGLGEAIIFYYFSFFGYMMHF